MNLHKHKSIPNQHNTLVSRNKTYIITTGVFILWNVFMFTIRNLMIKYMHKDRFSQIDVHIYAVDK